jgi:hypothetical protein
MVNGLVLDHFYFTLNDEEFEDFKNIFSELPGVAHQTTHSGDQSWEGVYMRTRTGSYLEFVKENKTKGFGLAISAARLPYLNSMLMREEHPNANWKQGQRITSEGKPWFDWLTLCDYTNHSEIFFNAWLMQYHQNHKVPAQKFERPIVDSAVKVEIECHPSMVELVKTQGFWLPGKANFALKESKFNLLIPDRDGSDIEFDFAINEKATGFRLKKMFILLSRGSSFADTQNKHWKATANDQHLEVSLLHHL